MGVILCARFRFQWNYNITKNVRVVSLACDTLSSPLFMSLLNIINMFHAIKKLYIYEVHKNLAWKLVQGR